MLFDYSCSFWYGSLSKALRNKLQVAQNKVRGLGFKFVDFLYKSSDVCYKEIKIKSSENTLSYLSYEILSF